MTIVLREATPDDIEVIRPRWARSVGGRMSHGRMAPIPGLGRMLSGAWWRRAADGLVAAMLEGATVIVATVERFRDDPRATVGFAAWRGDEILMVHVIGDVRRQGVGTQLLQAAYAAGATRSAYSTDGGRALERALRPLHPLDASPLPERAPSGPSEVAP